jgi:small ligand-binding sensory domain FIST
MLNNLKRRLPGPPRGGVYYSCLGRGQNLFGQDSEELRAIRSTLGDFPLVGFFANGEIHHNRLYGYTGVLTLFL